jgi:hypothetical protein
VPALVGCRWWRPPRSDWLCVHCAGAGPAFGPIPTLKQTLTLDGGNFSKIISSRCSSALRNEFAAVSRPLESAPARARRRPANKPMSPLVQLNCLARRASCSFVNSICLSEFVGLLERRARVQSVGAGGPLAWRCRRLSHFKARIRFRAAGASDARARKTLFVSSRWGNRRGGRGAGGSRYRCRRHRRRRRSRCRRHHRDSACRCGRSVSQQRPAGPAAICSPAESANQIANKVAIFGAAQFASRIPAAKGREQWGTSGRVIRARGPEMARALARAGRMPAPPGHYGREDLQSGNIRALNLVELLSLPSPARPGCN